MALLNKGTEKFVLSTCPFHPYSHFPVPLLPGPISSTETANYEQQQGLNSVLMFWNLLENYYIVTNPKHKVA
jgi:hypothetical protein